MASSELGSSLHTSDIEENTECESFTQTEVLLPPLPENAEGCYLALQVTKSPSPTCPRLPRFSECSDNEAAQGDFSDAFCLTPPPESLDLESIFNFNLPGSDSIFPSMTTLDEISLSQPPPLPSTTPMMKRTNSTKGRLRSLSSGLRKLSFNSLQSTSQALASAIHRDITPADSPISPSLSFDYRSSSKLSSSNFLKMATPRPVSRSSRSSLSLGLGLAASRTDAGLASSVTGAGSLSSTPTTPATDQPSFLARNLKADSTGPIHDSRNCNLQSVSSNLGALPPQDPMSSALSPEESQSFFEQLFESGASAVDELTIEGLCGYADFLTKKRQSSLSSIESACAKLEASGWCTSQDIKALELQRQKQTRDIDEKLMVIELRLKEFSQSEHNFDCNNSVVA